MSTKSKFASRSMLALATVATVFIALPTVAVNAASMSHISVLASDKYVTGGGGDMGGSVTASITTDLKKSTLCYTIKSSGIKSITGVHIHAGALGINGGVVVPLDPMVIGHKGFTCVKVAAKLLAKISAHPSMFYFNAHTAKFPNGAVRGQLETMAG
jgi:hypothetical protein